MKKFLIAVLAVGLLFGGMAALAATTKAPVKAPVVVKKSVVVVKKAPVKPVVKKAPVKAPVKKVVKPAEVKKPVVIPGDIGAVKVRAIAEAFVGNVLLAGKTKFTISAATDYMGVYKMNITLEDSSEPIESYMTRDGKIFMPQGMNVLQMTTEAATAVDETVNTPAPTIPVAVKSTKPVVELFVMSHCPYGTQIEKGIIPVVETLGTKIDFQLKFVDYAMHGEKELKEEMNQYCISKEQNDKLLPYLKCFLVSSDTEACLTSTNIDKTKLSACATTTETQYKIMDSYAKKDSWGGSYPPFAIFKAENTKYGVQGSPTLIINGAEANSGRDSASLLATVCSAFETAPSECQTKLSATSPSAGFGATVSETAPATAGGCGQ